jgi:hypothetical protein
MDFIERQVLRLTIWFLKRGYGADCRTKDTDDLLFPGQDRGLNSQGRCPSCEAREVIEFLQRTIDL